MRMPSLIVIAAVVFCSSLALARPRSAPGRRAPRVKPVARGDLSSWQQRWQQAMPRSRGRDSIKRRGVRAEAFNSLLSMARAPRKTNTSRGAAMGALLRFAAAEPNAALQKYAVGSLLRNRKLIPKTQRRQLAALRRQAFPTRPAIPKKGTVEVRHFAGDEFFRSEVAGYRRQGFKVTTEGTTAVATRGRLRVKVYKGDARIFRHMNDKKVHVVLFSGHSDVGGVNELSLAGAPRQKGDKLVVLLQCIGTQTMPMVSSRYSKAHVLTTKRSSYASADWNIIRSLMDGLQRGDSYRQIRKRARGRGDVSNYLFPDSLRSRKFWDMDRDGRVDFNRGRLADQRFNVPDGRKRAPGHKLMSAVRYLNSTLGYYAADTPNAVLKPGQVKGRLFSGGVANASRVAPGKRSRKVTQIKTRKVGRRKVYEVKLDPRYKRSSKAFVAASAIFEMSTHLTRKAHGSTTLRDKARGMLFAGDYLLRLNDSWKKADCALNRMCKMKGLPRVDYSQLQRVLMMDHHNLGTDAQVNALQRMLDRRQRSSRAGSR